MENIYEKTEFCISFRSNVPPLLRGKIHFEKTPLGANMYKTYDPLSALNVYLKVRDAVGEEPCQLTIFQKKEMNYLLSLEELQTLAKSHESTR